ncbi:MAG: hypothetical protein IJ449_07510 [Clostridia bacterium]|nr:hypothetical protein [Clostridia bacterium]
MKHKYSLASVLLALLTTGCILSCGDSTGNEQRTEADATGTGTETAAVTEDPELEDGLPEVDMDGWMFRMGIYGIEERQEQTIVDGQTGNIVNDAVYSKLTTVEERFNVDIVMAESAINTDDSTTVMRNAIMAGDDIAELVQGHDIGFANCALEGLFLNVCDIPYLDFSKPWWPDATLESMTVADQMYMMFNNISYNNLASTRVVFFNKTLLQSLDVEFPYQLVYDGEWTLDKMLELKAYGYKDLNGNGQQDENDQYGFINPTYYYCWFEPFRVEPYKKDKNGDLYYEVDLDKISTLTEKFYSLIFDEGGYLAAATDNSDSEKIAHTIFAEGRSMFSYTALGKAVTYYANSDVVYGVLPMPKYDESQDTYYGGSTDRPIAVPVTVTADMNNLGIIIEALNAEGYKQVYPAYYEIAMKTRYADQTDDANMLDLAHDNVIISFTYLNGDYKSIYNILLETLFKANNPSTDVASWCAKNEKTQTARVEKLQEFYDENRS